MNERPRDLSEALRLFFLPALLAGLTIFVMATIWDIFEYGIIFASFGSSAFIVYYCPRDEQASMPAILGAYPLAGFFGYATLEYLLPTLYSMGEPWDYAIAGGFAVGVTILAMLLTGFKHAPAAGAALAFILRPTEVGAVFFLIGGGITLLLLARIFSFMIHEGLVLEEAIARTFRPVKKE